MTIDDLFGGVYIAVQGPLRVMVMDYLKPKPEPEPAFDGMANNWRNIPDDVRNMQIWYIYPSTLREPRGQIVIEVMRKDD